MSVKAHEDETLKIEEILNGTSGVDATVRGEAYRRAGWSKFDENATPYGVDEIARERQLYRGEDRSFTSAGLEDDRATEPTEATPRPDAITGAPRTF